jgi:nucleoside-diphosphate-sugar epimerase
MTRKYLILGATGLIGSNLAKYILSFSELHHVTLLARDTEKLFKLLDYLNCPDRVDVIVHDINLPFNFQNNFDVVINAASYTGKSNILDNPQSIVDSNTLGTLNSLHFMKKSEKTNVRSYIYLSSLTVYGNHKTDSINEDSDFYFINEIDHSRIYAYSKLLGEEYVKFYGPKYNVNWIILRISSVYGYSINKPNTALYSILKDLFRNGRITLSSTEFPIKDHIYIMDVVSAIYLCTTKITSNRVYNVSSNGLGDNYFCLPVLLNKIIKELKSLRELGDLQFINLSLLNFINTPKLNNSKLLSEGWEIQWDLNKAISHFIKNIMEENL